MQTLHPKSGKIFVGGISPLTTQESLRNYFGKFGTLTDCVIMQDRETGKLRGFGFVTYEDANVAMQVLQRMHTLDGKLVECKQALPKEQIPENHKESNLLLRKIFVGGLPQSVRDNELKDYFKKFGKIQKTAVIIDKKTKKSRGFGFVIFTAEESVELVMKNYLDHSIHGKWVECKRAIPYIKSQDSIKQNSTKPQDEHLNNNHLPNFNNFFSLNNAPSHIPDHIPLNLVYSESHFLNSLDELTHKSNSIEHASESPIIAEDSPCFHDWVVPKYLLNKPIANPPPQLDISSCFNCLSSNDGNIPKEHLGSIFSSTLLEKRQNFQKLH